MHYRYQYIYIYRLPFLDILIHNYVLPLTVVTNFQKKTLKNQDHFNLKILLVNKYLWQNIGRHIVFSHLQYVFLPLSSTKFNIMIAYIWEVKVRNKCQLKIRVIHKGQRSILLVCPCLLSSLPWLILFKYHCHLQLIRVITLFSVLYCWQNNIE